MNGFISSSDNSDLVASSTMQEAGKAAELGDLLEEAESAPLKEGQLDRICGQIMHLVRVTANSHSLHEAGTG